MDMAPGTYAYFRWDHTSPLSTTYHRGVIVAYLYDSNGSDAGPHMLLFDPEQGSFEDLEVLELTLIDQPTYEANA